MQLGGEATSARIEIRANKNVAMLEELTESTCCMEGTDVVSPVIRIGWTDATSSGFGYELLKILLDGGFFNLLMLLNL